VVMYWPVDSYVQPVLL